MNIALAPCQSSRLFTNIEVRWKDFILYISKPIKEVVKDENRRGMFLVWLTSLNQQWRWIGSLNNFTSFVSKRNNITFYLLVEKVIITLVIGTVMLVILHWSANVIIKRSANYKIATLRGFNFILNFTIKNSWFTYLKQNRWLYKMNGFTDFFIGNVVNFRIVRYVWYEKSGVRF